MLSGGRRQHGEDLAMIQTVEDFDEATLFERLALDRVRPVLGEESISELDLRLPPQHGRELSGIRLRNTSSANGDNALTPLLFGAAWKILDLFVELALNSAGKPRKKWSIEDKAAVARRGEGLQSLLTEDPGIWRAVLTLYAATVEHRHCLVHRTAKFSSQAAQLTGVDKRGVALLPLTKNELDAFLVIAQEVASAVIAGGLEPRSADYLRFELDQLREHTGLSDLGGKRRSKPVMMRMVPAPVTGDLYELDFKAAYERATEARPHSHYDVWIDCPDDSGRTLFARMEDVPMETVKFRLDSPPAFLQFR